MVGDLLELYMLDFRRRSPLSAASQVRSLPDWATSSDFLAFEKGAEQPAQPATYRAGDTSTVDQALASQYADGVATAGGKAGVEKVGVLQPFKPQIIERAKGEGFTDQEAQYLYGQADKAAVGFLFRNGKPDATVTPGENHAYRSEIERAVRDPALRKRVLDAYEKQFQNGTLKRPK